MQNPSPNPNRTVWIVLVALAILACCCMVLLSGSILLGRLGQWASENWSGLDLGTVPATRSFSQSFSVDTPAALVVDVDAGSVIIGPGQAGTVEVSAEIRAYGSSSAAAEEAVQRVRFSAVQSGSTVTVRSGWIDTTNWRGRSPTVTVHIAVPERTDVQVDIDAGDVRLSGVEGNVDIQADVGRVEVEDVQVPETLEVETNVAEINFRGALTTGSTYRLTSDVGAVRMVLPADSAFAIDASSDVGAVTVEFEVEGETGQQFVGRSVQGVVGGDDSTTVTLRSDVGAISVQKR